MNRVLGVPKREMSSEAKVNKNISEMLESKNWIETKMLVDKDKKNLVELEMDLVEKDKHHLIEVILLELKRDNLVE